MTRFGKFCLQTFGGLILVGGVVGAGVGYYFYNKILKDLPKIDNVEDYRPKATTTILAEDGTVIAEQYDERRYPVELKEVPIIVRNAFLAAEDANFYHHPGIDITGIIRAIVVNLRTKKTKQGASTITQQIVKSLVLTREKTYTRKIKEAMLSYKLEKALNKDQIFQIYLNEIFLGNGAYGVKAAAREHFHKELNELELQEAAFLAGLPQKPSYLIDSTHRSEAINRQHYVLRQMFEKNMIDESEYQEALAKPLKIYPAELQKIQKAKYFADHAVKTAEEILKRVHPEMTLSNPGGLVVQTTCDLQASHLARRSLQRGLREVDKRRGWRGPLREISAAQAALESLDEKPLHADHLYRATVDQVDQRRGLIDVHVGKNTGYFELSEAAWARRFLDKDGRVSGIKPETMLKPGSIVEVSLAEDPKPEAKPEAKTEPKKEIRFKLDQTPLIQGAFVLQHALTGEQKVIIGGYDYNRSVFNRATQGLRQPGSSFKPFIYTAAIDELHYTPSTIVQDSPITLLAGNGQNWSPRNFDNEYLGAITMRTALQRSRNLVSVYLIDKLGVDRVIESARRFGITTPIGHDLSISLGTSEVHLIEMVHAYGAFAAGGWLADPLIITSIRDRDGNLLYEQWPTQKKILSDETAFIMANMMKGVVERGTAQIVKQLGRPVAGKTGTTSDQMDSWFIGYTPEWVAGIWVGFDQKQNIGKMETGGRVAAPVFLYFMQDFLKDEPDFDFEIPNGVIPQTVNINTGQPTTAADPSAFTEYFKSGSEPNDEPVPAPTPAVSPPANKDYLRSNEF